MLHVNPVRSDTFNIQRCMLVIGVFGIITIISYFNELAKAGLLFNRVSKIERYRLQSDTIVQRNARFDVDLLQVKQALPQNHSKRQGKINLALHIGNNQSYEKVNSTEIKVYQHFNVLNNYFLSLNLSSTNKSSKFHARTYAKATRVLLYQHEFGGYSCRDCVKHLAQNDHLSIPGFPLNSAYRKEWDKLPARKRNHFKVLYGGLSFGVCEKLKVPCNYFAMIQHPIDRVLQVYLHCKQNSSHVFCHFDKINVTRLSLTQFVRSQGSGLFKKLLYYNRRCRLVGEDEVCLQDGAAFAFSPAERRVHLEHITQNLHRWFSVVGLVEHYNRSLQMFEYIFKQNFMSCPLVNVSVTLPHMNTTDYGLLREKLSKDKRTLRYLQADLVIYNKLQQIFDKQWVIFKNIIAQNSTLNNTNHNNNNTLTSLAVKDASIKTDLPMNVSTDASKTVSLCTNCTMKRTVEPLRFKPFRHKGKKMKKKKVH